MRSIRRYDALKIYQDLPISDFLMLTNKGIMKTLNIPRILNENETPLTVKEIIANVPRANVIGIRNPCIIPETFTKLAAMERKSQISEFTLMNVNSMIDPNQFLTFIENHASKDASYFSIEFCAPISEEEAEKFRIAMKTKIFST